MAEPEQVVVFESNDRFTIALAKGTLEDAGVPFWVQGDEMAAHLASQPILCPVCRFVVAKDREAETREVLEPLLNA
ncbi:MAG: hypothetical protein ACM336_06435 [Acidobacteriota bacterium]